MWPLFPPNDGETKNRDHSRNIDNFISVKKFGEDLSTSIGVGKWGTVNCGAVFRWGEAESSRFAAKNEHSVSLFAADSVSFETLPVIFSFGLRPSVYSEFDNTVNPEMKISYKKDKWSLSFIYSRTNNIPSFYQRCDKTGTKEPNPSLSYAHMRPSLPDLPDLPDLKWAQKYWHSELFQYYTICKGKCNGAKKLTTALTMGNTLVYVQKMLH